MVFAELAGWDLLVVAAVVAVLFGGSKLPGLARSLGSARHEFEKGLHSSSDDVADEAGGAPAADDEVRRRIEAAEARRAAAEAELHQVQSDTRSTDHPA